MCGLVEHAPYAAAGLRGVARAITAEMGFYGIYGAYWVTRWRKGRYSILIAHLGVAPYMGDTHAPSVMST